MTALYRSYIHTIRSGYTLIVNEQRQTARFVGGAYGTLDACYDSASAFADALILRGDRSSIADRVTIMHACESHTAADLARAA